MDINMNINSLILESFSDENLTEGLLKKILGGLALAGTVGGAVYASHTPAAKGIYNGVKAMYHKNKAESSFKAGNWKDAASHGWQAAKSGVSAGINYMQSPTLQKGYKLYSDIKSKFNNNNTNNN